jgi:hypothetical protein
MTGALRVLLDFVDTPLARDPGFASNFQRIIETLIRSDLTPVNEDVFAFKLLNFAIANIDVLAYHNLVTHCLTDEPEMSRKCAEQWGEPLEIHVLRVAASHVFATEVGRVDRLAARTRPAVFARALEKVSLGDFMTKDKVAPPVPPSPRAGQPLTVEMAEYAAPPHPFLLLPDDVELPCGRDYEACLAARRQRLGLPVVVGGNSDICAYLLLTVLERTLWEDYRYAGEHLCANLRASGGLAVELLLVCGIY